MKYILIDIKNSNPKDSFIVIQPERVLLDDGEGKEIRYVCEKCFREFPGRRLYHLQKCRLEWPTEGICKNSKYPSFMLFKLDNEEEIINKKIAKVIINLAKFSKLEQNIDYVIPGRKILGKTYSHRLNRSNFYCYVLFVYKDIIAYCWIQIYKSLFGSNKVVIRDIYIIPQYRRRRFASKILSTITEENNKELSNLIFSMPMTDEFKDLLKKNGLNRFIGIQGENFNTLQFYPL